MARRDGLARQGVGLAQKAGQDFLGLKSCTVSDTFNFLETLFNFLETLSGGLTLESSTGFDVLTLQNTYSFLAH